MLDIIKLASESISKANFDLLEPNFSFIVNGKEYRTHKFVASLLSPAVFNLLSTDKLLNSFEINTKNSQGDFQLLLNLASFGEQEIHNQDKEFIFEILDILQNDYIHVELKSRSSEITNENVLINLLNDIKYPHYYRESIDQEIRIIAENMYRILCKEEERQLLSQLDLNVIERILSQKHLIIESEAQLLDFINFLYRSNKESCNLYQYVDFLYCDSASLRKLLDLLPIEDINDTIWYQLKERLVYSIEINSNTRKPKHSLKSDHINIRGLKISKGSDDFDGIINHLRRQKNSKIENELKITASSIFETSYDDFDVYNTILYDQDDFFYSQDEANSWICYEFQNHRIIPTHYTIQISPFGGSAPINFKIEILNDQSEWEEIDRQNGAPFGEEKLATLCFSISENNQKETNAIRLTQTGPNSFGDNHLVFSSIEFFGYLI